MATSEKCQLRESHGQYKRNGNAVGIGIKRAVCGSVSKHPMSAAQCSLTRADIRWQLRQKRKMNHSLFLQQLQQPITQVHSCLLEI